MAAKKSSFKDRKLAVINDLREHSYLKKIRGMSHEEQAHFWLVFWSDVMRDGLDPYQSKAKDLSEFEAKWLSDNKANQPKGKAPRSKGKAKDLIFPPPPKAQQSGSTGQYEQLMAKADEQRKVAEQAKKREIRTLETLIKKARFRLDELRPKK